MSKENQQDEALKDYMKGRQVAIFMGAAVYSGVVVLATGLFITFVLTAFPENAYFTRFIMTIGGIMVGGSMIAFPVALEKWAISGSHRTWAAVLYYIEIAIIAANTFVSFYVLMAQSNEWIIPAWVLSYEPFTIVSIVYTLAAWGTLFLTDPIHKATNEKVSAVQEREKLVAKKMREYLVSEQGENEIMKHADKEIARLMDASKYEKPQFGSARAADTKKEELKK